MYFHLAFIFLICVNFRGIISSSIKIPQTYRIVNTKSIGIYNNGQLIFYPTTFNSKIILYNLKRILKRYPKKPKGKNVDVDMKLSPWPGGQIPFIIDSYFSYEESQSILAAINDFHAYTCIRFVPYNGEHAYIHFTPFGNDCSSSVGYYGQSYYVYLRPPYCLNKGTVLHELMHTIGFSHEQNRHDRDHYVSIQWSNIKRGKEKNFYRIKNKSINNFGLPYDFGSIMHYADDTFTANRRKTIVPKFYQNVQMGQQEGLSELDVQKINKMYGCYINMFWQ